MLQWFADYLKDRKQRVVLPFVCYKAGVPQG